MNPSPTIFPNARRAGFTLVELMLSIAMVLLLMIGINAIFKTTSDTIGTGQAAMVATRDLRNAFDALDPDFNGFLGSTSQPMLMIYNQNLPGFRDKVDMNSDKDYLAANTLENALHQFDSQGNVLPSARTDGFGVGMVGAPVLSDNRNHRVDIVSFFSSGRFRRQTGLQNDSTATYQSLYNSDTAYIHIGHVRQPNNTQGSWQTPSTFLAPGMTANVTAANNTNGFFANQWVLGRTVILLGQPDGNNNILGAAGAGGSVPQAYLNKGTVTATSTTLPPFAWNTQDTFNGSVPSPVYAIQDSVCDVAGISASDFMQRLLTVNMARPTAAGVPTKWVNSLLSNTTSTSTINNVFRFACKPWATRPQAQLDFALSAPAFIKGCSQFTVEFAGDYVTQTADPGVTPRDKIIAQGSDNVLDFDIVYPANNKGVSQKRIRWYGMERRYPGNTFVNKTDRYYLDVRPVYSWMQKDLGNSAKPLPFEKVSATDTYPSTIAAPLNSYLCAWSPYDLQFPNIPNDPNLAMPVIGPAAVLKAAYKNGFMPWMIRLTIRVDDPNGRLADGQTIQYVFNLPHPQS